MVDNKVTCRECFFGFWWGPCCLSFCVLCCPIMCLYVL